MTRLHVLLALLCVCFCASSAAAICGSGGPGSRHGAYWSSDAVFVGRVLSIHARRLEVSDQDAPGGTSVVFGDDVQLAVVEAFRGVSGPSVTVWNERTGEAVEFKRGESYFFTAHVDPRLGRISVSVCDTTLLNERSYVLDYARWISSKPEGGRVTGAIYHEQWDPERNESRKNPWPEGVTITLTGNGRTWNVTPSPDGPFGHFNFEVPLGTYELRVTAPPSLVADAVEPFEVRAPERCHDVSVRLWWPGTVRGRLIDADGRPVPRLGIVLVGRRFARLRPHEFRWETILRTDDHGEFVHSRLAPGEYVAGVHIDSDSRESGYPAFYYPGVRDLALSSVIKVELQAETDLGDFRLPVAVRKALVQGVVLMPDGSPAAEASVGIYSEHRAFDAPDMTTRTDANGRFELPGVTGRRYDVGAGIERDKVRFDGSASAIAGRAEPVIVRLRQESF